MTSFRERFRDLLIPAEPSLPQSILCEEAQRFARLPKGSLVCIKVSAAHILPYPFAVSSGFVRRVVEEVIAANPSLEIRLIEGGVGKQSIAEAAERNGLCDIPNAPFIDAEASEAVFVPNPCEAYQADGFWLPKVWTEAAAQVLLTTCKLRSHHFQRWYSGGVRNLIGLLPREHYRLAESRRNMRSMVHKQGMDAMAADLYQTTGRNLLTILDGRLVARQDEHLPLRFVRRVGRVIVSEDPAIADMQMAKALGLPFEPPYLRLIRETAPLSAAIPR